MKSHMDVATIERYLIDSPTGIGEPNYVFSHNLNVKPGDGDNILVTYERDEDAGQFILKVTKDDDLQFSGTTPTGQVVRVRPPVPEDAIILGGAGVAQPIEVVNAHIKDMGHALAARLEAVVDGANMVLAVILRTGLGVYFRENSQWVLKRTDPNLAEGTSLQVLAPDALDYWDDEDDPVSIVDLPYIVDGRRIDPSEQDDFPDLTDDDEEVP